MSLHGSYDEDNIFAKILRGDMPCIKVYEDDVALAFMDVFPQSVGHTLVIPKQAKARNFLELPMNEVGPYLERVHMVTQAVERGLSPDGIVVTQFNGELAGQTVYHLHFHIIPRYKETPLGAHATGGMVSAENLQPVADKIKSAF